MDELSQESTATPEAPAAEHATRARRSRRQPAQADGPEHVGGAVAEVLERAQAARPAPETLTTPAEMRQPGDDTEPQKRKFTPAPDPFGIATDSVAGVRLFDSKRDRQVAIQFGNGSLEDKPSDEVIALLKEHHFRWDGQNKIWAKKYGAGDAMAIRIEGEQVFQEVAAMIRDEKGLGQQQTAGGMPF
jgi:hypothetical protein